MPRGESPKGREVEGENHWADWRDELGIPSSTRIHAEAAVREALVD